MKKLLTLVAIGMLAATTYGQGLVSIAESTLTISTNNGTTGRISSTANSYYFALLTLADPSGSTTVPVISSPSQLVTGGWSLSGVTGTNASGINGGKISAIAAIPGVPVSGWTAGTTNFTVVVGWSAAMGNGSDWNSISSQVQNGNWTGVFGYSLVGYGAATDLSPGFAVFGTNPGQINSGFTLVTAVPEPGTIALACMGGASLLLFRRRK